MEIKSQGKFNRYIVKYNSEGALRGFISYSVGGEEKREEFFLEAGKNMTFRSFIDGFIDKKVADSFMDVQFLWIDGKCECEMISLETEFVEPDENTFARNTFYLEGQRYILGIELAWGGGLSYLCDKQNPDKSYENILNCCDTGRLVQQSYYGRSKDPFVRGEFMGNKWVYNPVQGGDRANNKSKLIDVEVAGNYVYIKCRPRDWGHTGGYTFSYMENKYLIDNEKGVIRVDNRFVDFSGYEHGVCSQEVPAFYTISYLGNFWFYGGSKPWTDDKLEVRRDLFFWPEDWPKHTFNLDKANTETWCAWTDDGDYGVGLYVPGADRFIGGRFSYNGSKDPKAGPTNYVAPCKHLAIKCFKPIEYSYLITTGMLSEIRAKFNENRDFCDNASLKNY